MIGTKSSYFIAAISSIGIHAVVIVAVLVNWEPDSKKTLVQPQYIQAELIQLAPKKVAVNKPKSKPAIDRAAKQREIDKRRAKEKKLAQQKLQAQRKAKLLKDQQEAEKARQRDEKIRLREEKEALREQRRLEKEEKARAKAAAKKPSKRRKKLDPGEAGFYK